MKYEMIVLIDKRTWSWEKITSIGFFSGFVSGGSTVAPMILLCKVTLKVREPEDLRNKNDILNIVQILYTVNLLLSARGAYLISEVFGGGVRLLEVGRLLKRGAY